jgi:hypothetical protein
LIQIAQNAAKQAKRIIGSDIFIKAMFNQVYVSKNT